MIRENFILINRQKKDQACLNFYPSTIIFLQYLLMSVKSKSSADVAQVLKLHTVRDRAFQIQPCSAKSGEGVREGLEWALKQVKPKK